MNEKSSPSPFKLTFAQLALMEWLMENPTLRFFVRSAYSTTLYEIQRGEGEGNDSYTYVNLESDKELLARFGGRAKFDDHGLWKAGLVQSLHMLTNRPALDRFVARFSRNPFHYNDSIVRPKQSMVDYWNAHGKEQLRLLREKRASDLAAVERWVVIGCTHPIEANIPPDVASMLPSSFHFPFSLGRILKPYALARVVKETETRVYVDDVKPYTDARYRHNPVSGSASGAYVERSSIMLDPATPAAMDELVGIFNDHVESVNERVASTLRDIAPALQLLQNKLLQGSAMYDDLIREALERHAGGSPKP